MVIHVVYIRNQENIGEYGLKIFKNKFKEYEHFPPYNLIDWRSVIFIFQPK